MKSVAQKSDFLQEVGLLSAKVARHRLKPAFMARNLLKPVGSMPDLARRTVRFSVLLMERRRFVAEYQNGTVNWLTAPPETPGLPVDHFRRNRTVEIEATDGSSNTRPNRR